MSFMRFFSGRTGEAAPEAPPLEAETEAVRRIVTRLETLPPEKARLLAGMAYVLARAANADMRISDVETHAIEDELVSSGLDQSQAVLVAEMAKLQERKAGETSDYLVTREFREASNPDQRLILLRACFQVAAADGAITAEESATLDEIANELDIERGQATAVRAQYADLFTARLNYQPKQ
jgi:uncharacterized tellurite resistance protein B-like protein